MGRGRSYIAWRKASRTFRIPAGDPADGEESCDCANYLLTEAGEPIQSDHTSDLLRPEP